jgi:trehalose synthase-fused probable maltokinase
VSAIEFSRIDSYLKAQRWFTGKAGALKAVHIIEAMDFTKSVERPFVVAVVQATYELGQPDAFFIPLTLSTHGELADALEEPALAEFLFDIVREGRQVTSGAGVLRGMRVGQPKTLEALGDLPSARLLGREQTNSSVVFGDRVIFKALRKLQPGLNPELEVGGFLASHTSFRSTPPLLGALQLEGALTATVALAHEFVYNLGDGFRYLTDAFAASPIPSGEVLGQLESMGSLVGRMHLALASDRQDPAFAPEPIEQVDLQRWSASIIGELGVTLAAATRTFPELIRLHPALLEQAQRLAHLPPSGLKIRQHGDLHLGQILRVQDGWWVIDFEGEPTRGFEQRREKHSPLRDVAGMLRSFAYAAAFAGLTGKGRQAAVEFCREFFLKGYRQALGDSDLLPTEDTLEGMLAALEMEKAFYEIRYELQARPDWAHIPVEALLASTRPSREGEPAAD